VAGPDHAEAAAAMRDGSSRAGLGTDRCDARIRPFPNDTEIACEQTGDHDRHSGTLREYASAGSVTVVEWLDGDRRSYRGDYPGPCSVALCSLPSGHRGSHA
jgi:hypothetical protein